MTQAFQLLHAEDTQNYFSVILYTKIHFTLILKKLNLTICISGCQYFGFHGMKKLKN